MLNKTSWMSAFIALAVGNSLGIGGWPDAAQAQSRCVVQRGSRSLTCATIYQVFQNVRLNSSRPGFPRMIAGGTVILSNEQLRTFSGSRAELQFNDGSLAWMRSGTTFEFRLGLRLIQLRGGATLVVFYSTNPLVAGLGPGQEAAVAARPAGVQQTLNAVRVETLAAAVASRVGDPLARCPDPCADDVRLWIGFVSAGLLLCGSSGSRPDAVSL